ncbi:MAG: tubulin-like doman-containing protein [Clostridium sp.]
MNKRRILLIGCGKAGNKLVNDMVKKDRRLTGLFVNTAYDDMADLEMFKEDNAFLFSSADGSGRNRLKAQEYVKEQINSLVDVIAAYPLHDVIYIFTSADGGTGSGMTPMFCKLLKMTFDRMKLNKKINLVAVMPSIKNDDKVGFENALSFWNELTEDKKGNDTSIKDTCINNLFVIDNSKGDSYKDINERAVNSLVNSFNMNGHHDEGDIDDSDAKIFNTESGYGIVLELDKHIKDAKIAVDNSIRSSVFAMPDSYDCNYIGISLCEDDYLISDVRECFDTVYKAQYQTYNNKSNTVVLSGCYDPNELIENIKNKLDEINERYNNRDRVEKKVKIDIKNTTHKKIKKEEKAEFTEKDIEDISSALEDLFG